MRTCFAEPVLSSAAILCSGSAAPASRGYALRCVGTSIYADLSNSSRPISMRRISLVPAPISYSFASRSSRPVG